MTAELAGNGPSSSYRLMTYNIGGGRKRHMSETASILQVIRSVSPDILALQETTRYLDADGLWYSDLDEIAGMLGKEFEHTFAPTLTTRGHMHPVNKAMVEALFADYQDWQQGNALVSRWPFHRLGSPGQPGIPRSIPLYRSPTYEGNRDTEPRSTVIARIGRAPQYPMVVGVHLSTLVGERGADVTPGKPDQAAQRREMETRRLIALLHDHVLSTNEIVFLLGDFNAALHEVSIRYILDEGGFIPATPTHGSVSTHDEVDAAIDHIFLFPSSRILEFKSYIVDTPEAHQASDHLPVVTEVTCV